MVSAVRVTNILVALATLVSVSLFSNMAVADLGDISVTAGISYDQSIAGDPGFGSTIGVRIGISDEWRALFSASYAAFPGRPCDLLTVTGGIAYLIDVASWVPELFAGIGYLGTLVGAGFAHDLTFSAGLGLEYRRYREFGVGFKAEYRLPALHLNENAGAVSIALYVAYHF